jgi:predicted lipid-binding transport protein (Tim44 family)
MRLSRLIAVLCAGAFAVAVVVASTADARTGGGRSSGSRGSNTFSAPPSTNTAPGGGATINRSVTQPNTGTNVARPGTQQPAGGGMFNRPGGLFGGGLLGGLAMGFLGAGLFGLLMGNGLLGGLGGLASMFGLLLQVAIVAGIAWFAWSWWQRRQQPALAQAAGPQPYREMFTGGGGSGAAPPVGAGRSAEPTDDLGISPADYDAFEKLLGDIQAAYSNEDITALRQHATPEMVSYFAEDLAENTSRGVVNRVSDVKLLQGDLAEAWREGSTEYATVAMKFSLVDQLVERASGRVVEGDARPQEVVEIWTFMRGRGGNWILSAIQQA